MKNILLLLLTSLLTAALLSYTLKTDTKAPSAKTAEYAHCAAKDVREIAKLEALTKQFAALHEDPLYFELKDPKGKTVSFSTPDGQKATGYEIKNEKSTKTFFLSFTNGMASTII